MKRKAEILFSVVGVFLFFVLLIGSFSLFGARNNVNTEQLIKKFILDENISVVNADQITIFLGNSVLYLAIISIISIVLGIISIVMLKKDTKIAGKTLITTGLLSIFFTLFTGLLGGIAYVIAGTVAISRRSKNTIDQYD